MARAVALAAKQQQMSQADVSRKIGIPIPSGTVSRVFNAKQVIPNGELDTWADAVGRKWRVSLVRRGEPPIECTSALPPLEPQPDPLSAEEYTALRAAIRGMMEFKRLTIYGAASAIGANPDTFRKFVTSGKMSIRRDLVIAWAKMLGVTHVLEMVPVIVQELIADTPSE
jgi:hypothetical protein